MNKMMKFGAMAAAVAMAYSAQAEMAISAGTSEDDEIAAEHGGAVGYTAVAVSLASPVQLPWGIGRWDVFGLDLGIFYNDVVKMYGLDVACATTTRGEMIGLVAGPVFNYATTNVYGMRATLIANICRGGTVYGIEMGAFGYHKMVYGLDAEFLACIQEDMCGLDIALVGNLTENESCGVTLAGGVNLAHIARGAQIAGVFNQTDELHGCQIGLINFAKECPWGFQVGLINIILDNKIKILPIVNGYF